jgi:XTP/dITP diphosphohydrolase
MLIATTNSGKRDEYQQIFSAYPVRCLTLADVGLGSMDVEETGQTFMENALLKANVYQKASGLLTLADDSGIAVDALNGAPGVYSARYAPTVAERNAKLIAALTGVPGPQRTARFICVMVIMTGDGLTLIGEGRVEGSVGYEERGQYGHGYDPVFVLPDQRHLAELLPDEKNQISHRGRAIQRLLPYFPTLFSAEGA